MNWYYVEAGQQAGPVDESQLTALEQSGKLQADTLVWHEGMADWRPYREVRPATAAPPITAPPVAAPIVASGPGQAVCAECGGLFNLEDTIPYGTIRVCANCKPILMQKLAEGAKLNLGPLNYAGFWVRFGAVFLDGVLLWIVNFSIAMIAGLGLGQAAGVVPVERVGLQLFLTFLQLGIGVFYEVFMIGKFGATLGKMACKIQVVTAEGGKVSYLRALGRHFAKYLSAVICLIGYIIAAFDDEKRALHDRLCNTRVVFK